MKAGIAALATLALLAVGGCTITFGESSKDPGPAEPTAPTNSQGVEQWDLRTRPTADDVRMPADRDVVVYETDDPRPVEVLLPEGRKLRLDARLVTFDRLFVPSRADKQQLTGMDFRSDVIPLDEAYALMKKSLVAFGMSTKPAEEWRSKIEDRPTTGVERDFRIEGGGGTEIGYLDIGVGGVFDPRDESDTAILKYRVNFES